MEKLKLLETFVGNPAVHLRENSCLQVLTVIEQFIHNFAVLRKKNNGRSQQLDGRPIAALQAFLHTLERKTKFVQHLTIDR